MKIFLFFALPLLVASQEILPPIPLLSEDPGVKYFANSTAPLKLEAFFELNCGDSSYAWGVLKDVAEYYGPEKVNLVIHQQVLPYHRNAFLCLQGYYAVQELAPQRLFDYMDIIFANIGEFSSSANIDRTERETTILLADLAQQATDIDSNIFRTFLNFQIGKCVFNWKYAARLGVAGTPWFFINNIDLAVNAGKRLSFDDWTSLLDPLVQ